MLDDGELAGMRSVAGAALPDTAIIQTHTFSSDGGGEGTAVWAASGTVACRITPILSIGQGEMTEGDRITSRADYIVTLPYDAPVTTSKRLSIGGEAYNVTSVRDGSWQISLRAEVRRKD